MTQMLHQVILRDDRLVDADGSAVYLDTLNVDLLGVSWVKLAADHHHNVAELTVAEAIAFAPSHAGWVVERTQQEIARLRSRAELERKSRAKHLRRNAKQLRAELRGALDGSDE